MNPTYSEHQTKVNMNRKEYFYMNIENIYEFLNDAEESTPVK